jgi:hypothetical protein
MGVSAVREAALAIDAAFGDDDPRVGPAAQARFDAGLVGAATT